jgi:hypothetical protein
MTSQLESGLARTRPNYSSMHEALLGLDPEAAGRFERGEYREHFRPDENYWTHPARSASWARGYLAHAPHLEKAASTTLFFGKKLSSVSPLSEQSAGETLSYAAGLAQISEAAVATDISPIFEKYLTVLGRTDAPMNASLVTEAAEIALLNQYHLAANLLRGTRVYNHGTAVCEAVSLGHYFGETLTFLLYCTEQEEVDGYSYHDAVQLWLGRADWEVALGLVKMGVTRKQVAEYHREGLALEYVLAVTA